MTKRGNANTWVLSILLGLIVLMGIDIGRHYFVGDKNQPHAETPPPMDVNPKFKVGDTAPDFVLKDAKGKNHALSELVHRDTILAFNCGCANCRDMETYLAVLFKRMGPAAPDAITVTSMVPEREESWFRDTGLKQTLLYTPHGDASVMDMYKGHPCPRLFRLSADRKVKWMSPSLAQKPDFRELGGDVAAELGFSTPGHKVAGKPEGPAMQTDAPPVPAAMKPQAVPVSHPGTTASPVKS